MYLSLNSIHRLDIVIKDFEVAYRSFIVHTIKTNFADAEMFREHLISQISKINNTSSSTKKFKQRVSKILEDYSVSYYTIELCNDSITNKKIPQDGQVPYVGTLIDYVYIFFEQYFKDSQLLKGFSKNDFFKFSHNFHKIRNDLSHPASSRILIDIVKDVVLFIEKLLLNINEDYFWYSSKQSIKKHIDTFLKTITGPNIRINNIDEITYNHKKLIQRDKELATLRELIFGKPGLEYYRKARSIVIYGYGGLGKTALVIEFINEIIKECIDTENSQNLDFLLYFTAKEEELTFSTNSQQFQISELNKQIDSFQTFTSHFFKCLGITSVHELSSLKGLLVIDNLETLKEDKEKILEFIKILPDSIQVIITSREEEIADNKIPLKGYDDISQGARFIKEYIDEYELDIEYSQDFEKIIKGCKGNTLILILSLLRLNEDINSFSDIVLELNSTSSASISTVANFMYKNTFDKAIKEIEKRHVNPKMLLSVIAYYNEPIDLYSLTKLSNNPDLSKVETICELLLQMLVLTKKNELYEINEFAAKFIIVKIIPNRLEAQALTNKISDFKFNKRKILRHLEEDRSNSKLNNIMRDWMPRNNIEKIAIAEAYNLFSIARSDNPRGVKANKRDYIREKFVEIESYSQHPYVKFQKARIFSRLLRHDVDRNYFDIITSSYEEAIFSIKFDYQYIAKTQSFAIVLWLYGLFLKTEFEDFEGAARNLEEAKSVCESLSINNENYIKIRADLATCYHHLYKKTRDKAYLTARDFLQR